MSSLRNHIYRLNWTIQRPEWSLCDSCARHYRWLLESNTMYTLSLRRGDVLDDLGETDEPCYTHESVQRSLPTIERNLGVS